MENQSIINEKQSQVLDHKAYLYSTDYVIVRSYETKIDPPDEIIQKRTEAREAINLLEQEISDIMFDINVIESFNE